MEFKFKSELHIKQTYDLLKKFGKEEITDDKAFGSFAYIVGATFIADSVANAINEEARTLNINEVQKILGVCSIDERKMLRFALQCFNSALDDITIGDVMLPLDKDNKEVILYAIKIRY